MQLFDLGWNDYFSQQFEEYKIIAQEMGFLSVASGSFVRSSYHADELIA